MLATVKTLATTITGVNRP